MSDDRQQVPARLIDSAPRLQAALTTGPLPPRKFQLSEIRCETVMVPMRDGIRLATDIYLPPVAKGPVVIERTPYDRAGEERAHLASLIALACRGYIVVAQDVRGTGLSEPDVWDHYMYEPDDGYDMIEWVIRQPWYDGFIGSFGGSYVGQTQWHMALHPQMTTIVPHVSGLGLAVTTGRLHMFLNAYAKSVGKGDKLGLTYFEAEQLLVPDTLASGFFNEPIDLQLSEALASQFPDIAQLSVGEAQAQLWHHYCALDCAGRAAFVRAAFDVDQVTMPDVERLAQLFGQHIPHDRHTIPNPSAPDLMQSIQAPPLFRTSWYDWFLNDALETFSRLREEGQAAVADRARLIITPHSHNTLGYKEGLAAHPELSLVSNYLATVNLHASWYEAVARDEVALWPTVIYYLMGANIWCTAQAWPPPEAQPQRLYLSHDDALSDQAPTASFATRTFSYDPLNPTPTLGGCLVSSVIAPGSVDVSDPQGRPDVLTFTSPELASDLDVVGPLKMVLYASSSAVDTDFVVRLSDVFPDGRAIQLQNGLLRARYRDLPQPAALLQPGKVYAFEIDMWATANRFRAGHRLRIDISSADFPRFDRNANTGGLSEMPVIAHQTIHLDRERPSHLVYGTIGGGPDWTVNAA